MSIDKSLLSGSMALMIMKLLSEKDMYGYEMIDELRRRSENVFELKAGTLYPILHSLENKGFVKCYEKEVVGKVRKYYGITKAGKKELETKTDDWHVYSTAVGKVLGIAIIA